MDIYRKVEFKEILNFLLNNFYSKVREKKDIEKCLKLKVLGVVPIYSGDTQKLEDKNHSKTYVEDSINDIRTNILSNSLENNKSILVTSCNSGEGKSWIAVNIGVSFTTINKKVLLIVTDMLKENLEIPSDIKQLKEFIKGTSVPNLDILTNNVSASDSSSLLDTDSLKELIKQFKNFYDIIIIDGPSSNFIKDGVTLSSVVDSTVLVASSGQTKLKDMKRINSTIQKSGGTVIGAILNKYKVSEESYKKAKNTIKKDNSKKAKQPKNKSVSKQKNKEKSSLFLKTIIKKQNKHIEKLEKNIVYLNKRLDNNQKIENAINEQNEKFKQELENNNDVLKKIIAEEIIKMQENLKEEIRQEVVSTQEKINDTKAKITKETQEKIEKMQKEVKTDTRKEVEKINEKTNKEIQYIQKKIKADTKQEISKINQDKNKSLNTIKEAIFEEIEKIQEKAEEDKSKEIEQIKSEKKTVHPISEDIKYEDLEKTASYIISLKKEETQKETPKEYKFNMRYIYGKYFRRDKVYNEKV